MGESLTGTVAAGRPCCAVCRRPLRTCLCPWVRPVAHPTRVLILQHPQEVSHAKNSARLLHLSLTNSRIWVGDVFDPDELAQALQGPRISLLLYPDAGAGTVPPLPRPWPSAQSLQLVVLDATWRKSRQMLHRNPLLADLPRLALEPLQASVYRIRKAHLPGQLSTLEATCQALAATAAGRAEELLPLLQAFEGWVDHQQAFSVRSAASAPAEPSREPVWPNAPALAVSRGQGGGPVDDECCK